MQWEVEIYVFRNNADGNSEKYIPLNLWIKEALGN